MLSENEFNEIMKSLNISNYDKQILEMIFVNNLSSKEISKKINISISKLDNDKIKKPDS